MLSNGFHFSHHIFDIGREDEELEAPSFKFVRLLPDMVNNGYF